jgi:hypothetical protein
MIVTYAAIQADVRERTGRAIKTCWIAHVKSLNGLPMRTAPNRQSPNRRVHPCPDWARPMIEDALRRHGVLA